MRLGARRPARGRIKRRLGELGLRPNLELGQNFLDDPNLLAVIERAAELDADRDVVLEVGGGLGTLSEHLAPRVRHLHVVEVDRALAGALEESLAAYPNSTLHRADALRLDWGALDPPPAKLVANLPYGVAATVLLRTIQELPAMTLWVAMVQREVADRIAAGPGSRVYGATSVIAQLACEARVMRRVGPTVFHPRPHVDSALLRLRRVAAPPARATVALVHAAFAHRRKTLAGSLALAPGAPADIRARARAELEHAGHPADARAERLSPEDFEALAAALGEEALEALEER
jgi:16S rRNA (adenine1518-N6/adenine1519-N6)-dimethyltransferase